MHWLVGGDNHYVYFLGEVGICIRDKSSLQQINMECAILCMLCTSFLLKGECSVFLKKIISWIKTIHYPNTLRSHLVTIVPMASLITPKSTSKLKSALSALHFSYSIVIRRFYSRANTVQS